MGRARLGEEVTELKKVIEKKEELLSESLLFNGEMVKERQRFEEERARLGEEVTELKKEELLFERLYFDEERARLDEEVTELKKVIEEKEEELLFGLPEEMMKARQRLEERARLDEEVTELKKVIEEKDELLSESLFVNGEMVKERQRFDEER